MRLLIKFCLLVTFALMSFTDAKTYDGDMAGWMYRYYDTWWVKDHPPFDEEGNELFYPKDSKKLEQMVQLPEITPFHWDTLFWIDNKKSSDDISKIVGGNYENKAEYEGKQKLIFIDKGKVIYIYPIGKDDVFTPAPFKDSKKGYFLIPKDRWFRMRADKNSFSAEYLGASDIYVPQKKSKTTIKVKYHEKKVFPRKLPNEPAHNRLWVYAFANVDLHPLMREMRKKLLTEKQFDYMDSKNIRIILSFDLYIDTGEIFDCSWEVIGNKNKIPITPKQWAQMTEMILKMRIDPQMIGMPDVGILDIKGKRLYTSYRIRAY